MANPKITLNDNRPVIISGYKCGVDKTVAVHAGAILPAGAVMGIVTADGKLLLSSIVAVDGSEVARYVLTQPVDALLAEVEHVRPLAAGVVNGEKLVFDGIETLADHYDNLKANGIIALTGDDLELFDNT